METTSSTPKARKVHHCEVCGWDIEIGETYHRTVTFDGGDVLVWKSHDDPCQIATESARAADYGDVDGLIDGDAIREWASEVVRFDYLGHPEAVELQRRLKINDERWRAKRIAELKEEK